ncbi:hypothetical protein BAE44_0014264, partial [Dichanthelium oligosanthes]
WRGRAKLEACQSAIAVLQTIIAMKPEAMISVTLLWVWWGERNSIREGGQGKPTETLLAYIIRNTTTDYAHVFLKTKEMLGTR